MLWKPEQLNWAWLALLVIALYVWRVRPIRTVVSTGFLWQQLLPDQGASTFRWRLRWLLSLSIQLLVLGLLVLSLTEPLWRPAFGIIAVVDGSAGMNAVNAKSSRLVSRLTTSDVGYPEVRSVQSAASDLPNRALATSHSTRWADNPPMAHTSDRIHQINVAGALERSKHVLRCVVSTLGSRDEMAIVVAGEVPEVLARLTADRHELEAAIDRIAPGLNGADVARAISLARQLSGKGSGRIVVFSDLGIPKVNSPSDRGDAEWVSTAWQSENDLYLAAKRSSPTVRELLARHPDLPLWRWLAIFAMFVSVGEWLLFQRQWTC